MGKYERREDKKRTEVIGRAFLEVSKPTVIAKPVANVQEELGNFQ
jgi:hypothetical protein